MTADWTTSIQSAAGKRVLVIGDVMLDRYVIGDVSRVSPEAPVNIVNVSREFIRAGGAANVSLNLAALGLVPVTIGIAGDDEPGRQLRERFQLRNLDVRGIIPFSDRTTTQKTRVVARGQQLLRVDREVKRPLTYPEQRELLARIKAESDPAPAAIILSDYGKGVVTGKIISEMTDIARRLDIPILVDPYGNDYTIYRSATILTPNRHEAGLAVNKDLVTDADIDRAARDLIANANLKSILITCGADGMVLHTARGDRYTVKSEAIEVYDVTGAGDTVISAFAAALVAGMPDSDAVDFANRAAAVSVSHIGTYSPTLADIQGIGDGKIRHKRDAKALADTLRARDKTIVFTNGCFDLLHVGHIKTLESAAGYGDVLIVGVNSDQSVRRLKGENRPVIDEMSRARLLAALRCVGYVIIFDEDTPRELIHAIRPDVLCKGGDYTRDEDVVGWDIVKEYGGKVARIPIADGFSTTNIVSRILTPRSPEDAPRSQ